MMNSSRMCGLCAWGSLAASLIVILLAGTYLDTWFHCGGAGKLSMTTMTYARTGPLVWVLKNLRSGGHSEYPIIKVLLMPWMLLLFYIVDHTIPRNRLQESMGSCAVLFTLLLWIEVFLVGFFCLATFSPHQLLAITSKLVPDEPDIPTSLTVLTMAFWGLVLVVLGVIGLRCIKYIRTRRN